MDRTKKLLSYIFLIVGFAGILSLYFSLITNIESSVGTTRLRGYEVVQNLFNGSFVNDGLLTFFAVVFIAYILFLVAFLVLAVLNMCGKNISRRLLQVMSVCLLSFAILTFASAVVVVDQSTVIVNEIQSNIYHLGTGSYVVLLSSMLLLISTFIEGTYEVLPKK